MLRPADTEDGVDDRLRVPVGARNGSGGCVAGCVSVGAGVSVGELPGLQAVIRRMNRIGNKFNLSIFAFTPLHRDEPVLIILGSLPLP